MTDLSTLILPILESATANRPVTIAALSMRFGISERSIKAAVSRLRRQHHPIGAIRGGRDRGYFYCRRTLADFDHAFGPLRRQAIHELVTYRAARRRMREVAGQMRLRP